MVITRCSVCGDAITGDGMGRHALITIEKYSDSGMKVDRYYLCEQHEQEMRDLIEPASDDLADTARCCGTD